MDRKVFDERKRIGRVKAAINNYRERFPDDGASSSKKSQTDFLQKSLSMPRELYTGKRSMARNKGSERAPTEFEKLQEESELPNEKSAAEDQIEELHTRLTSQMRNIQTIRKPTKKDDMERSDEAQQYSDMMRELEYVKKELNKIKQDMASVVDDKLRKKKEIISFNEDVIKEQVQVGIAEIEALNEHRENECQQETKANGFASGIKEIESKKKDADGEIDHTIEFESKLALTLYNANVLQNELEVVKEMEKGLNNSASNCHKPEGQENSHSLISIDKEIEATKRELALVREEGIQFMASTDIIRNELKHVKGETTRLKQTEDKADLTVQNLKSKLLRAKTKLEAATSAEEKAKSLISNLSQTLEQSKTEVEVAKKEKELVNEETENIKAEIKKTESEIELSDKSLQAAMQELEAIKSSEAIALNELHDLIESTIKARASTSHHSSAITIPKFEYEYLTGQASGAERLADKKVSALQAWIEAIKSSEKEIMMRIETVHREIKNAGVNDEQKRYRAQRSQSAKTAGEREVKNLRQKPESSQPAWPNKMFMKGNETNGTLNAPRRRKLKKAASYNNPVSRKKEWRG